MCSLHSLLLISLIIFCGFLSLVYSLECYCDVCVTTNYTCVTDGYCFTTLQVDEDGEMIQSHRCFHKSISFPPERTAVWCEENDFVKTSCCLTDFCNNGTVFQNLKIAAEPISTSINIIIWVCGLVSILIGTSVLLWTLKYKKANTNYNNFILPLNNSDLIPELVTYPKKIHDIELSSSGSGSGLPLLVQRSIARQIQLKEIIGQGRFGEVWRGKWRSDNIAVKIFSSRDESSWFREAEIYQTVMLRHENILGFIAADNKDNGTWTQLWLITDYHENGSLYDYLNRNTISLETSMRMIFSIANGLSHLHADIQGTTKGFSHYQEYGKPGIAHRDMKSKNILVKTNLTCVIADLGLAVRHDVKFDTVDIPTTDRVGTRRYMSPEVLTGSMDPKQLEPYKQSDIYSFGLIIWEILRRSGKYAKEYQLPYYDCVPSDPTLENMIQVVVVEKKRPRVECCWRKIEILSSICKIMEECWYDSASARLTALRIKKNVSNLLMKSFK